MLQLHLQNRMLSHSINILTRERVKAPAAKDRHISDYVIAIRQLFNIILQNISKGQAHPHWPL